VERKGKRSARRLPAGQPGGFRQAARFAYSSIHPIKYSVNESSCPVKHLAMIRTLHGDVSLLFALCGFEFKSLCLRRVAIEDALLAIHSNYYPIQRYESARCSLAEQT